MLNNFDTKEYSPRVIDILNGKPGWFISYGTLLLFILIGVLLFVSTLIKIQNNINIQFVIYDSDDKKTIIENSIETKTYFGKLLQKQKIENHKIYALIKSPVKVPVTFKIGQTILLKLPSLSMSKARIVKCTILGIDKDIFDNKKIIIVSFNFYPKSIDFYRGKKNKALIIMKKVTIFDKFKCNIKYL